MGTSSPRRGPTTPLWRAAKGAATRYLSPGTAGGVSAQEVVARYLAAVAETPGPGQPLAVFRLTRKAAQELGAFWDEVRNQGLPAALAARGWPAAAPDPPEMPVQALSEVLAGSGGGLEEAVVRTALALVLQPALPAPARPAADHLVRQFLATALHLRLVLDVGESLEAAAPDSGSLQAGLDWIRVWIETGALAAPVSAAPPATAAHWQGLMGWVWITEIMAAMLSAPASVDQRHPCAGIGCGSTTPPTLPRRRR